MTWDDYVSQLATDELAKIFDNNQQEEGPYQTRFFVHGACREYVKRLREELASWEGEMDAGFPAWSEEGELRRRDPQ